MSSFVFFSFHFLPASQVVGQTRGAVCFWYLTPSDISYSSHINKCRVQLLRVQLLFKRSIDGV